MTSDSPGGYSIVADALEQLGVSVCFALMGDCNIQLLAEISERAKMRLVQVRDENMAVAMADGFSRVTNRVGFATVTCGPGLTQAVTSLVVAARRRSPIVLIVGDLPLGMTDESHHPQQRALVESIGAGYLKVESAADLYAGVCEAFETARCRSGPVVLSIPVDLQHAPAPVQTSHADGPHCETSDPKSSPEAVEAVIDALGSATRPILIAGRGADRETARALVTIAEHRGALLATTVPARDLFAGHPRNLGIAGGLSLENTRDAFGQADLIIGFGTTLSVMTRDANRLFPQARVLRVDRELSPDEEGLQAGLPRAAQIIADAVVTTVPRASGFGGGPLPQHTPRIDKPETGLADPEDVVRFLGVSLPADTVFVNGIGHYWWFPMTAISGRTPESYVPAYEFGVMGQALPTAAGVSTGTDRPVLVFEGDGGLMTNLGELETLARESIDLFIVVLNDGAYGAEVHKLRKLGRAGTLAEFGRLDIADLATGLGVDAYTATEPAEIFELFQHRQRGGPTLVNVPIAPAFDTPTVSAMADRR